MEHKTQEQLLAELKAYVRSAGDGEKTTAADIRQFLILLVDELFSRTDVESTNLTVEQDLTSDSISAVPSIAAVNNAFEATNSSTVYNKIADAITSDLVRTYHDNAQLALEAAGPNGTANIYSLTYNDVRSANGTVGSIILSDIPMVVNLYGLFVNTPDANTDLISIFGSAKRIINGNNTTIVTNKIMKVPGGQGWTIYSNYTNSPALADVTINDLNLVVTTTGSHGIVFFSSGNYRYSGNIEMPLMDSIGGSGSTRAAVIVRGGRPTTFYGKGNIIARGVGNSSNDLNLNTHIFAAAANNRITWQGNIFAYEDAQINVSTGSTLELISGILDATARIANGKPLFATRAGTIILSNFSILCNAGEDAVFADTLILRGNSVVRGKIVATTIIDERPESDRNIVIPIPNDNEPISYYVVGQSVEDDSANWVYDGDWKYYSGDYHNGNCHYLEVGASGVATLIKPAYCSALRFTFGANTAPRSSKLEIRKYGTTDWIQQGIVLKDGNEIKLPELAYWEIRQKENTPSDYTVVDFIEFL